MIGTNIPTQNVNTPSIQTGATALAANTARIGWTIQNLSTNPLFVLMGSGASTSVFHVVARAGTVQDDGSAGSVGQETGVIYNGIITVAGTGLRYVAIEFAP